MPLATVTRPLPSRSPNGRPPRSITSRTAATSWWVWNTTDVSTQSDKDLRARAYYANYRMALKFAGQDQGSQSVWGNCLSFSLHSNAAGTGTARGTENFWYTSVYPYLQTKAKAYCTAVEAKVINAIKNEYDGFWAESMYPVGTVRPEWPSGTYRGYDHDGASHPLAPAADGRIAV